MDAGDIGDIGDFLGTSLGNFLWLALNTLANFLGLHLHYQLQPTHAEVGTGHNQYHSRTLSEVGTLGTTFGST